METIKIKTTIYSGEDALEHLSEFEHKKIWLICDQFLVQNGSVNQILDKVKGKNQIEVFKDVVPDPPIQVVASGVALAVKIQPDVIIAYGGGSAIDTAKGIIYFSRMLHCMEQLCFVAIPTTSGTGSEVTSATVITDQKIKHPIFDDDLVPDEVILCPVLTVSVPGNVTANTGIDVLTHAIEAYVATKASAYSDALAEKACELVFTSLLSCYQNGNDLAARSQMQQASNLAGTAFNLAGLGMNHAIAHQLGGIFHIPHGLANSLLLTSVIEQNSQECCLKSRYAALARKLSLASIQDSEEDAVKKLIHAIDELQHQMKMPTTLSQCNVVYEELKKNMSNLTTNALKDNCILNAPCTFSKDIIEKILLHIY